MLLENVKDYYDDLGVLWKEAFGDSEDYVNLLFNNLKNNTGEKDEIFRCFAAFSGDHIVSVIYLLDSRIRFYSEMYQGYYLYAAATLKEYRGQGIMANLIDEAKKYAADNSADYIVLVPGSESLYDYYGKYGFQTAMYRYSAVLNCKGTTGNLKGISVKKYMPLRNIAANNMFFHNKKIHNYLGKCLKYSESQMIFSDDFFAVVDSDEKSVIEFISIIDDYESTFKKLSNYFLGKLKVYSPYDMGEKYKSKREPFGMIYPVNDALKRDWSKEDIYMNFALD